MKFIKKYSILFLSLILFSGCQFPTFQSLAINTPSTFNVSLDIYKKKIFTINTVLDVEKYVDKDSLVIFDIDLTLVKEYLKKENGEWHFFESGLYSLINKFLYKKSFDKNSSELLDRLSKLGISKTKSEIKKIFKKDLKPYVDSKMKTLWGKLESQIDYKLMEKNIPEMISNLQRAGNKVMCFTAREWGMKDATREDLLKVSIDAAVNTIYDKLIVKQPSKNNYGFGFDKGVLSLIRSKNFTTKTQKGRVLLSFFDAIGYKPVNVVFADNRMDNVQEVVEAMNIRGIPVKGLWYKFSGYIEKPVLLDMDVTVLDRYFGLQWWNIEFNINKIVEILFHHFNKVSHENMGDLESLIN